MTYNLIELTNSSCSISDIGHRYLDIGHIRFRSIHIWRPCRRLHLCLSVCTNLMFGIRHIDDHVGIRYVLQVAHLYNGQNSGY